jgi:hypothetical protein
MRDVKSALHLTQILRLLRQMRMNECHSAVEAHEWLYNLSSIPNCPCLYIVA